MKTGRLCGLELLAPLEMRTKYSPSVAPNLLVTANWHLTNDPSLTHDLPQEQIVVAH